MTYVCHVMSSKDNWDFLHLFLVILRIDNSIFLGRLVICGKMVGFTLEQLYMFYSHNITHTVVPEENSPPIPQ